MWGCRARIYAQNFDAVLVVIVILAGEAIFVKIDRKCRKYTKLHNSDKFQNWHVPKFRECLFGPKKAPAAGLQTTPSL